MVTYSVAGTLTSGIPVLFDSSSIDNYYSFYLNSPSTVLIVSDDLRKSYVSQVNLYDSSFNKIQGWSYVTSESISLQAGSYYFQPNDNNYGYLTVHRNASTLSVTPLVNGEFVRFYGDFYSFTLNSQGTVLITGADSKNAAIEYVKIFDSNFNEVKEYSNLISESLSLNAGIYYIQADEPYTDVNSGVFSVSSNAMSGSLITSAPITANATVSFDNTYFDNFYSLSLNSANTIIVSGTDGNGGIINKLKVFDNNFNEITYFDTSVEKSLSLNAGTYYFQPIDSNGGTFNIISQTVQTPNQTTLSPTQISQLYTAIFNRASEGGGNQYWQDKGTMASIANQMLSTLDAQSYFGNSLNSNQAFIEHIYLNTLNKTIAQDPGGIAYWKGLLDSGSTRGEVVASLVNAIGTYAPGEVNYNANDTITVAAYNQFANRVAVSNYMAQNVFNAPSDYAISTSFSGALTVTNDSSTVMSAKAIIDSHLRYVQIDESSYSGHTLAIDTQGDVYAWGDNQYGQIGDGTVLDRDDPVQITTLSNIKFVEAGAWCSFAITNSGDVYAWGGQSDGMLGDGVNPRPHDNSLGYNPTPTLIEGLSNIVQIDSGFDHVLAVDSSGNVYGWGENYDGQLGPLRPGPNQTTPLYLSFVSNIVEVSAGLNLSIALDNQGKIFYWGDSSAYDTSYTYPKTISSNFTFTDIDETTLIDTNGVQHSFYDFV